MNADADITELQGRLRADPDGTEMRRTQEMLGSLAQDLRRRADVGVAPGEFLRLQAIRDAVETAEQVLEIAWQRCHQAG